MKKGFLIAALGLALGAAAQTKEGTVVYERTIQIASRNFGNLPADVQAQLPKSRTSQYELLFTAEHSLWQFLPSATEEQNSFGAGGMMIRFSGMANETAYVKYAGGSRVDQREIFDRSFVVTDTVSRLKWRLSEETRPILNFTARKATATQVVNRPRISMENGEMKREMITDTVGIVAWYTTEVPVPAGPDFQGQLPGLMLELDVNNGQTVTKAISFSPKVAAGKIKEPKEGKRMTAAEFAKERDKMMDEMRRNMPQGRNMIRMN